MVKKISILSLFILFVSSNGLLAQLDLYGAGVTKTVPYVEAGSLTLDGVADEGAWSDAATINMFKNWDGGWGGRPDQDVEADVRLLWTTDTLFLFVEIENANLFFNDTAAWQGEHLLVGIDGTHTGDTLVDYVGWSGWPENAPDLGAVTYKINEPWGITLGWDDSAAESFYSGVVFYDSINFKWGVELGFYVGQAAANASIGFNIGGGSSGPDSMDWNAEDYASAYYSWQYVNYPGGDVQANSGSFGTLKLRTTTYGTGYEIDVPGIAAGTLTMDGQADEAEWTNAATVDMLDNWDGAWGGRPIVDVDADVRLLWAPDTLFLFVEIENPNLFFNDTAAWQGEHLLIGIDGTHAGDTLVDYVGWSGWPENAPDLGPFTYKITEPWGITIGWDDDAASGLYSGLLFYDSVNFKWGVELGIYVPQIEDGASIGFNIGGGSSGPDSMDWNHEDFASAYYSWGYVNYPGGDVQANAGSFGTLNLLEASLVSIDDETGNTIMPAKFGLKQNYPNPFNPSTSIPFYMKESGMVEIKIYDILGNEVESLVNRVVTPGSHATVWHARNTASGIYFYSLYINNRLIDTRKTLLLQ